MRKLAVLLILAVVIVAVGAVVNKKWTAVGTVILRDKTVDGGECDLTYNSNPRQLDHAEITVDVKEKSGAPLTGCLVTAEPSMPSMAMPRTVVGLTEVRPGTYTGQLRYTMAGAWIVHVRMTRAGVTIWDQLINATAH